MMGWNAWVIGEYLSWKEYQWINMIRNERIGEFGNDDANGLRKMGFCRQFRFRGYFNFAIRVRKRSNRGKKKIQREDEGY